MNTANSKADLHVHSKFSNRPSEWFLRRIGAPESFMEPMEIYQKCKRAGMDFVTISDHNCIRGALEIADLPDTFISSELTTYFPENGCKIHCLVSGIQLEQFDDLQQARENIYDLQAYLRQHDIIHSIAHPLFRINDRLTPELFEKLMLLFNRFEGINGSRNQRACGIGNLIFEHLTPDLIHDMANRHGLEPVGDTPWIKTLTGGSDDHSGLYIAGAYTETPYATHTDEFLEHLRLGNHKPGGSGGTSIRLANSLYKIAYGYYASHFLSGKKSDTTVIGAMLRKLSGETARKQPAPPGIRTTIKSGVKKLVANKKKRQLSEIERLIVEEFSRVFEEQTPSSAPPDDKDLQDLRNFETACRISQQLTCSFLSKSARKLSEGNIISSLQSFSSLGPIALGIAPFLTAFATQHKDELFLQSITEKFPAAGKHRLKSGKRAWITDTFNEVNGVAHTINTLASLSHTSGDAITVVTCMTEASHVDYPYKNFQPVDTFRLPEYESQDIPFPPFLELLHYLEEEAFDELIISTPGTLGLSALYAARLLGLSVKGIYHTDFPEYVRNMTGDDALSEHTWKFMRWFYKDMQVVFAPTEQYRRLLIDHGFDPPQIRVLPRGVDLEQYSPANRNPEFWTSYNLNGGFKFLYVGRVSKEKNLDNMIDGFLALGHNSEAELIIVGDGPYCDTLRKRYQHPRIAFTGFLHGSDLHTAYASADVFVFPSMTDTFGNAVLEAHASGLPAIVSNCGGPQEIVTTHDSGLVIDARTPDAFRTAMDSLFDHPEHCHILKERALKKARCSRWEAALNLLNKK